MVIQHNISAINSQRNLGIVNRQSAKALEQLSSGYRVNRAGDDAAGLAISEKMRGQIRGLGKASENVQHAISLTQTADGALQEIHAILQRGRELAVQAANGTYQVEDREAIQLELDAINKEIDRIAVNAKFNGIRIFTGTNTTFDFELRRSDFSNFSDYTRLIPTSDINYYKGQQVYIKKPASMGPEQDLTTAMMEAIMGSYDQSLARCTTKEEVIERMQNYWIPNAMQQIQDTMQSFAGVDHNIYISFDEDVRLSTDPTKNLTAVTIHNSTITSDGVAATKIGIVFDLDEYLSSTYSMSALARTVAHELVHAFMDELMPGFMSDSNKPTWFSEGVAELISGGMQRAINDGLSNIKIGTGQPNEYSNGYLAVAYASYLVSGADHISASSLTYGLDLILSKLRETDDLDATFQHFFGMGVNQFETEVTGDSLTGAKIKPSDFVQDLKSVCGTNGAGALMAGNLTMTNNYVVSNRRGDVTSTMGFVFHFSNATTDGIHIQASANNDTILRMQFAQVDSGALGVKTAYIAYQNTRDINPFIDAFDQAINKVSMVRAQIGAFQNRLEHAYNNLTNTQENLTAAESSIRDVDMAKAMMDFVKNNILTQSAQAMLLQANNLPQGILQLLQ